jgi:TonB family protein
MKNILFSVLKLNLILLLFCTTIGFAQEENEIKAIPFEVVDETPYLSDCKINSKEDKKKCFQDFLNNHIKKYFNYPAYAKENGTQGRVLINFVIDEKGIVNLISVKGEKEGLQELEDECFNIIEKLDTIFIPAIHKGENVSVSYSLPISFRLETTTSKREKKKGKSS